MKRRLLAGALLATLLVLGQSGLSDAEPQAYVATIQTVKGRFRAVIRDPEMIAKARQELAGQGDAGVPYGDLEWGHGGVNRGHVWHIPELAFADVTIELCDGTVKMVDRDPVYWVETVGAFCPWSGDVVSLRPLRER